MQIEILNLRPITKGNLRGFVDLKLNDIEIRGFRIIREDGKTPWVSVPQVPYKDKEGKIKYFNMIGVSRGAKDLITEKVLAAWNSEE